MSYSSVVYLVLCKWEEGSEKARVGVIWGRNKQWRGRGGWSGFSKQWRKIQMGLWRSQERKMMMWKRRRSPWNSWPGMLTAFSFGSRTIGPNSPTSSPLLILTSLPYRSPTHFPFIYLLFCLFLVESGRVMLMLHVNVHKKRTVFLT